MVRQRLTNRFVLRGRAACALWAAVALGGILMGLVPHVDSVPLQSRMLQDANERVAGSPGALVQARKDTTPPNIIVILADDLGYGDLGAYGQKKIKTPRLDRMAEEGIRFTNFYAGHTVCAPSRVALLTGVGMAHSHTRSNQGPGLREEDVVIPEVLKRAGYATGVFGKWGFGEPDTGAPDRQGFDEFLGYLGHVHAHSYYTDHLYAIRNGRTERIDIDTTRYTHDLFTDAALDFIDRNRTRPFFLYLPYTLVHAELLVPNDAMAPYRDENGNSLLIPEKPFPCCGVIGTYRAQSQPHAAFAGMVTRLDRDVGRILDRLSELGLDDNTLVIFTSDNGPHFDNRWGGHYVQAVQHGDWKLLRFREPNRSWVELYDLSQDVGEYNDLSSRYPDVVARLGRLIDEVRTEP